MGPPRPLNRGQVGLSIPRGVFREREFRPSPSAESAVENEVV